MKKHILLLFILYFNIAFSQIKQKEQTIEIPVIFHIVDQSFEKGFMKKHRDRINYLINKINEGFNNVNKDRIELEYRNVIANCKINFKLTEVNNGITWHLTDRDYFEGKSVNGSFQYDEHLKKYGYINSEKHLNIWICDLKLNSSDKFLQGYSTNPSEQNLKNDGIVLSNEILITTDWEVMSSITNHEIGHWLGLKHIWGDYIEINCLNLDDDGIDDTPKQKGPHKYKGKDEVELIQKICLSDKKVNYENFMDYSNIYGMFTKGQAIVMRDNIFKHRKGFLSNETNTTNTAVYQNMSEEIFNYYVISSNNLDYKNNDIYLTNFIKRIKKLRPKSEFELKKLKTQVVKEVENNINNLNTKYKKSNYVTFLRDYNFEENYFPFKINDILWDWSGSYSLKYFPNIEKYSKFRLYAVNVNDFENINLSEIEAEKVINTTNQRSIYPQIEYTTLKLPVKNSKGNIVGMFAYVDRIKIFSDMRRTKLIYTLNPKSNKKEYEKYNYAVQIRTNYSFKYQFY